MRTKRTKTAADAADNTTQETSKTGSESAGGMPASWALLAIGKARESRGLDSPLPIRRRKPDDSD